jgi:hypothetical protein
MTIPGRAVKVRFSALESLASSCDIDNTFPQQVVPFFFPRHKMYCRRIIGYKIVGEQLQITSDSGGKRYTDKRVDVIQPTPEPSRPIEGAMHQVVQEVQQRA